MKILVADDDAAVRRLIRRFLTTEMDVDVWEANDGLGALELLQGGEFDLLIMDIKMGPIDGAETLEAIRNAERLRDLPVVMISGAADESRVKRLKSLGVKGLVAKPLSLAVLRERLMPLIFQLGPTQPSTTTPSPASRLNLHASSRVFVVGSDRAYGEFLHEQLGRVCKVTLYPTAMAALREAVTQPPHIVFVTSVDPLMSPAFFARAMRREMRTPPKLVLCGPTDDGGELFDERLDGAPAPPTLLRAVRSQLTDAGMTVVLMQAGSRVTTAIVESAREAIGTALGEPVLVLPDTPRRNLTDEPAIEASVQTRIGSHAWELTLLVTQTFALRLASRVFHGNTDLVFHAAAVHSVEEMARDLAFSLKHSLTEYEVSGRIGSVTSRRLRLRDGRIKPGATDWWFAAVAGDTAVASVSVSPAA